MAQTIKGKGVIWSVGSIEFTGGIVSVPGTGHFTQSASVELTSEVARIKDTGGTVKTVVFSGAMKTLRISIVPVGTAVADAIAKGNAFMPSAGTKVDVTDDAGAIIDDSYNCLSATQNRTVDGVSTIDLVLEAGDEGVELATNNIT